MPLSHLSHLQLIPPSQSPPSSLNTHNSAQLILNLSQPPVFSHRPANSEVDLKCYDFTSKSGASASIHKLVLDGKQMAEMELFVEEITQELRALENWFIPSTSSIDIWSPKNGELDMHYSSDVSSSSSHSDFDSTFDGDNSSSNFSTPELGDKWEEEDHFWMDDGYCEEEKKELNGLGLIIENDLPPFCPFTPKPRVTQIFPLASPELIKTKTSQTLGLDPRILENSFNLPDKISRSIPPLLPPLSFKSPQPKSPYSYHRSRGSHLDLSPISPRKLSHLPLL